MKAHRPILLGLFLVVASPLAGGLVRGLRPGFFRYPPLVINPPVHSPFSLPLFLLFALTAVVFVCILAKPRWFGFRRTTDLHSAFGIQQSAFPPWGWVGLALTLVSWTCAWGRFEWLGFMKQHMFAPLWLGYVLSVDGLVYRRKGSSILSRTPATFLALFPASAIAWWYFEYLNRFIQNWWYRGIEGFGPGHYILYSSLCFSSVLPAVFETCEWLMTTSRFGDAFREGPKWRPASRAFLVSMMIAGTLGLVLVGLFPDPFFFATWIAPLAILEGALGLAGIRTSFHGLTSGDYGRLFALAVAALVCGFFWEMWNVLSLPQWNYSVPYVNVLHVFEMPVVGYAGYFPFGPVCWCFWLALAGLLPERGQKALSGLE